jgi:hypothetical protein
MEPYLGKSGMREHTIKTKRTGEYSYLSDEAVGILPHDKLDASLKAKLIEEAVYMSYGKSGQKACETISLTSQTVMNSIRELGSIENEAVEIKQDKRTARVLYIEADEDHVALQDGGYVEPKLVYVHEGKKRVGQEAMGTDKCKVFQRCIYKQR